MATAAKKTNAPVPFTNVINTIAKNLDLPATDVAKSVRAHIRTQKPKLVEAGWTNLDNHEHGNRYPDMPRKFAEDFIAARVSTMSPRKAS